MTIGFRKFLEAAVASEPKFIIKGEREVMSIITSHCKDALWMIKQNKPIYRGHKHLRGAKADASFMVVDTTKTERASQNTTNYYTMILDNNPAMEGFPKRSRSFIGSTSKFTAGAFSSDGGSDNSGKTFAMIPYDGVGIGVCPQADMWHTRVNLLGLSKDINDMNDVFEYLDLEPTLKSFVDFSDALSEDDPKAVIDFTSRFKNAPANDFLNDVWEAYSPENLRLKKYTTATLPHDLMHREVWVGGTVLLVDIAVWSDLVEKFRDGNV